MSWDAGRDECAEPPWWLVLLMLVLLGSGLARLGPRGAPRSGVTVLVAFSGYTVSTTEATFGPFTAWPRAAQTLPRGPLSVVILVESGTSQDQVDAVLEYLRDQREDPPVEVRRLA